MPEELLGGGYDLCDIGEQVFAAVIARFFQDQFAIAFDRVERRPQIMSQRHSESCRIVSNPQATLRRETYQLIELLLKQTSRRMNAIKV